MKRLIKSSQKLASYRKSINASVDYSYTDHYKFKRGAQQFSIYTKYADDPDRFQCQITELHPYDLADYYWIKKDQPAAAKVIDPKGHLVGRIELAEYDEDSYEDANEYIRDIIDYMCTELRGYNRNIKPRIDHT